MTRASKTLTTSEYAKISGLSTTTITKQLRTGELKGQKINGKWAIDANAARPGDPPADPPASNPKPAKATAAEQAPSTPSTGKAYDVDTFTRMTYLTEKGVRQFLKSGRLSGSVDDRGNLRIDADNLNRPELRHLIRK